MRKILKGVVTLCVLATALAMIPLSKAKAEETKLFVHKSPDFTVIVPKDWKKTDKYLSPGSVLKKPLMTVRLKLLR
jgi:hypothetical protein